MRIAHVISSIDTSTGGPARSVTHLIDGLLHENGIEITLHSKRTADPIVQYFTDKNGNIAFHPSNWLGQLANLEEHIDKLKPDLLHGHGLWQMPVHQMAKMARKHGIPYILTPRGMLDEWSLAHKGFKKKIALWVFQERDLNGAAVLHATSKAEKNNIRKAGFKNPIVVIPNGINLPPVTDVLCQKEIRNVLFLSRLVPNKGIKELLEAWQQLDQPISKGIILDVVGEGKQEYVQFLKKKIRREYKNSIRFHGAVYGNEKKEFYKQADLFVLPTYTENFGIVVAEALSYGVPVITTKGAPWEDLEMHGAGWWIEIGVKPLKAALEEALSLSAAERETMGKRGRALVREKYSIESVAENLLLTYRWILGKTDKPKFITE